MRAIYINEKRKLTKWKIKRIAKKIDKISREENVAIAISNKLQNNENLLQELEEHNFIILNR